VIRCDDIGPPDEVSRQQIEDRAEELYERVEGAP
jgi:hypothetical protein